ncbi:hypothetical protein [Jannaschia sp. LMIT008]|uniref:hypothetical protein n=1 Tax=Jannaschia maritima TaxID=3032585 RepID=UPI002811AB6A|nr:hypothetical protein [Jannaschia sp. LMIT008]
MSCRQNLAGFTILLLEDEPLIALDVETALQDAGARVVGPTRGERGAMEVIDTAERGGSPRLGGAVLDVHLGSHTCERVAMRLIRLRVPFVFHTGNQRDGDGFVRSSGAPVIRKPALGVDIVAALCRIV